MIQVEMMHWTRTILRWTPSGLIMIKVRSVLDIVSGLIRSIKQMKILLDGQMGFKLSLSLYLEGAYRC